jgi:hypothetical protein
MAEFEAGMPDTLTGECEAGFTPVYRLVEVHNGNHRWITDPALRAKLVGDGWISEGYGDAGVAMCAPRG